MMKINSKSGIAGLVVVAAAAASLPAHADCPPFSNFESGSLNGWLESTTGGTGSTTVDIHNGSKMAYVQHTGDASHTLSCDAPYSPTSQLSFEMHAVATGPVASLSGVRISFLNVLNVTLGSLGLFNSNGVALSGNDFSVDAQPHTYSQTMSTFASLAGLSGNPPIAKISMAFVGAASSRFGPSQAGVWFDNVAVGAVPEPTERALLLAGLAGLAFLASRRKRSEAS